MYYHITSKQVFCSFTHWKNKQTKKRIFGLYFTENSEKNDGMTAINREREQVETLVCFLTITRVYFSA